MDTCHLQNKASVLALHPGLGKLALTRSKRKQPNRHTAVDPRVDALQLPVDDPRELRVARRARAVRRRREHAGDVERVARVRAVRERVRDQVRAVRHAGRLGEVDHRVRDVLLRARVRVREERVQAVEPGELDARLVCEDVTTADELS